MRNEGGLKEGRAGERWLSFQDPGIWGKGEIDLWGKGGVGSGEGCVFTPKNQEYASISIPRIFLCAWQINTCLILL